MSAEAWRRRGTHGRRGLLRDRRDTFSTAGSICVAGVTLSAPEARFAWQVWHFQYLQRCERKLGDEGGRMDAAGFCVTGVTLSAPEARLAWQA